MHPLIRLLVATSLVLPPLAASAQGDAPAAADPAAADDVIVSYAVSQFGPPKYGPDFAHFDYVNPDAPKGGSIVLGEFSTFDTLNTIPLAGDWPTSIGLIYDELMAASGDELTAAYGLIAETAEYPADRSWIIFNIRPEARWHDGEPITADDVKWTFDKIREVGRPFLKAFYDEVESVDVLDERRVRFNMSTTGRMSPLMTVAGFSPLPRHWWEAEGRDISRGTLEPVLGSGPYRIAAVDPGRSITYERVEDYWAAELPVQVGQHNFDRIRYDYFRDREIMTEAFLGGAYDFHQEYRALNWTTRYDTAEVVSGKIRREEVPDYTPQGIQAFFFNTRRAQFADPRVRQALGLLYDFETTQRQLLYGQYQRVASFYPNSDFASSGLPSDAELEILEPFRDQIPDEVFTQEYRPPVTDGTGNIRPQLREAQRLFQEAGWEVRNGVLTNVETGQPLEFEIMLIAQGGLTRLTEPWVANLQRAGVRARIREVDSAQYTARMQAFDYDVMSVRLTSFMPPGTEQRSRWSSQAADTPGSSNFAGIKDPVVDELIEQIVAAPDLEAADYDHLVAVTRALDRVLLWGHYVVPQYYNDASWIAYWDMFGRPDTYPRYDLGFPVPLNFENTWWFDADKAAALGRLR